MRRNQSGTVLSLAATVAVGLLWAGCEADRGVRLGGTAVLVDAATPRVANPLVASDAYSLAASRHLLFLPLLRYDAELELVPRLAESWELDGDTAAVFRLRRGVRWSDGVETSAHDVAFTVERALDAETGYPNRSQLDHVRGVTTVDSFTVRVAFDPVRQAVDPIGLLPILPRHVLDTVPPGNLQHTAFNLRPVTNGPFTVIEARPGQRWIFGANEAFPQSLGGRPRLDRLVWRGVPESAAQIVELRAGEADVVTGIRHDDFARLGATEGIRALERPTLNYAGVAWNGRREPLSDARVRRALTLAMDRRGMVDALRGGHGTVATGPVPPGHWAHSQGLDPAPHDPDAARALLAEAGYGAGGQPIQLTLLIPAGADFSRDLAQVIQSNLAGVGVRLQLRALEWGTLIETITGPGRDYDAVLLTLNADPRIDLHGLFHSAHLDGPFQVAGYSHPTLDAVLDSLQVTPDVERSRPLWDRAQRILAEDQPWSFLYYETELILVRDRLREVEADLAGLLSSAQRWWIEADEG